MDDDEKLLMDLEACLERIERGESVDACLRDYPAARAELEPMLRVAASLRALPPPPPPNLGAIEQSVLAHAARLRHTTAPAVPYSYSTILLVAAALAVLAVLIGAFLIFNTLFGGANRTPPGAPSRPSVTPPATVTTPIPPTALPASTIEASPTSATSPTPSVEASPAPSPSPTGEASPTMLPSPSPTSEASPTMLPTATPPLALPTATFQPPPAPTAVPSTPAPPPPPPAVSPPPDNDDNDDDDDDDDNDDDDD